MKTIILAGGFGTRLAEETDLRPKPMIEIGGKPIIWHIMKHYSLHGINEFVICLGYKSEYIKKYFIDYAETTLDFKINLRTRKKEIHPSNIENWDITLINTGLNTMTGGRIKRAITALNLQESFCLTYGDGLSNVDITSSILFHQKHSKLATVTAVTPPGRFGVLDIDKRNVVKGFREKISSDQYRINGGFFVLEPGVAKYIEDDSVSWEQRPLEQLANDQELIAWEHDGFWQPMDTLRDKKNLEDIWQKGNAPWSKI